MSIRKITVAIFALLVAACTTIAIDLPAITEAPTGQYHNGKVVWRDLLTNTPEESRRFYSELFGWEFETPRVAIGVGGDETYMLIRHNGDLIGGMVDTRPFRKSKNVSQWITAMSVRDIEAATERVTEEGGKVLTPPRAIGKRGTMAVIEDPTGALFAMIQTHEGDPEEREPEHNGWLWDELWTSDVDTATGFYQNVIGFQHTDHDVADTDRDYRVLTMKDEPRAGVLANPFEGERPVWVNYIRVTDPSAITARVEGLGGEILVESQERPIGGEVAFIAGPSGAGVALQTWPLD